GPSASQSSAVGQTRQRLAGGTRRLANERRVRPREAQYTTLSFTRRCGDLDWVAARGITGELLHVHEVPGAREDRDEVAVQVEYTRVAGQVEVVDDLEVVAHRPHVLVVVEAP